MRRSLRFAWMAGLVLSLSLAAAVPAQEKIVVEQDGTVHVPALSVPPSNLLSPEAKAYLAQHLHDMQSPEMLVQDAGVPRFMKPYLARMRVLYPVLREDTQLGAVHVYVYKRNGGAPVDAHHVLINLHGGGFSGCWPGCAELESIPIAALSGMPVVSVDYREGPEHRFPAASEDVAAVYAELLKQHRPEEIGIYGCSAGGMLTAMSVAWFQAHHLPRPGAVGIFCAGAGSVNGAGFGGDAAYTALPLGEARMPRQPEQGPTAPKAPLGYLAGADPKSPLVAPINSVDALRQFPPTLLITATRGFEMSGTIYTNEQLSKAGVSTELHVWDGLFHGFFYNPDVPESRDCYDVIVRFFRRALKA